jgi:hypothetical protein
MALAKQKSRDANDGGLDALPRTGSRCLSERSFDCAPARRKFWLSLLDWIAFSKNRVIGIRHIDRNFGSLPGMGNSLGKASSSRETSCRSTNTRILALPKSGCVLSSMSAIESTRSSTG